MPCRPDAQRLGSTSSPEMKSKSTLRGVMAGLVLDVMPDGTGVWVYVDGVGRRLFGAEEDVEIMAVSKVPRPDISVIPEDDDDWRLF